MKKIIRRILTSLFCVMLIGILWPAISVAQVEKATFAGGCFWCMEPPFELLEGVKDVTSGYMGGEASGPTYENYADTGHIEVVQITFDSSIVHYEQLLNVFWRSMDPTDGGGQFGDRGPQYRPAIFVHNAAQREKAKISKKALEASGVFEEPIAVEVLDASEFYPAEEYHQDYAKKHPIKYKYFKYRSGRTEFLKKTWG